MTDGKRFEFVFNGKTYQTQKMNHVGKAKILKLSAFIAKETQGYTNEDIKALEWLQVAVASVLYEHAPPILWDFLSPADKNAIGTKDVFCENLNPGVMSEFFNWATAQLNQVNDFLPPAPVGTAETSESPSITSSQSLPAGTDGILTPLNP